MEVFFVYIEYHDVSCFNGLGRWFFVGEQPTPTGFGRCWPVFLKVFPRFKAYSMAMKEDFSTQQVGGKYRQTHGGVRIFGNVPSFAFGNKNMVGWLSKEKETGGHNLRLIFWEILYKPCLSSCAWNESRKNH